MHVHLLLLHLHLLSSTLPRMNEKLSETAVRAWAKLVRAESAVLAAVERDLKAAGYPPLAWYDVLLELKRAPQQRLRPLELEPRLLLQQYNLSRLIDRIEAEGLVERQKCATDARGHNLVLLPAGRELLRKMWPVYERAIARHFADKLAPGEAAQLAHLLDKLLAEAAPG